MQPKQLFPDSSTYTRTPWIQAKLRIGILVGVKCYLHLKIKTRIRNASYDFWSNVNNIGHSLTNSRQKVSRLFSASATVHYLICKNLRIVSNRPTEGATNQRPQPQSAFFQSYNQELCFERKLHDPYIWRTI